MTCRGKEISSLRPPKASDTLNKKRGRPKKEKVSAKPSQSIIKPQPKMLTVSLDSYIKAKNRKLENSSDILKTCHSPKTVTALDRNSFSEYEREIKMTTKLDKIRPEAPN